MTDRRPLYEGRLLPQMHGLWYLASPYSNYPLGREIAFAEVCEAAAWLMDDGVQVFCPIAHTHPIARYTTSPDTHEFWLCQDQAILQHARGVVIYQLPEWAHSYGVTWETGYMRALGGPVLYMRRDTAERFILSTTP